MNPQEFNSRIAPLEQRAYFESMHLELVKAAIRYGDKAVFDFISDIVSEFNSNATVVVSRD